ncbi:MAG: TIM barrel protein [Pseudomonadota bacterium]
MTVPHASTRALCDMARSLGCVGVELRNDLAGQPFDGLAPESAKGAATEAGLAILGLAEMKAFNRETPARLHEAQGLMSQAAACGAKGIALIPAVADAPQPREMQRRDLRTALLALQPLLEAHGLIGLIEPLGFPNSTLRHKEDVVAALEDIGDPACFSIVHDTFHHCLAGGGSVYADRTAIVHVSGVTDPDVTIEEMTDAHRVLVDTGDRLDNIGQLRALIADGYAGPISFEAFAPEIHDLTDPTAALAGSIAFITQQLQEETAGAA